MRTIFEKGDKVKLKQDWRDWKKGEGAIIVRFNERPTPLHNDSYTIESINGTIKDFNVILDYMIEINFNDNLNQLMRNETFYCWTKDCKEEMCEKQCEDCKNDVLERPSLKRN